MYAITKESQPPSWRRIIDCSECIPTEYCAETAPGEDWVWDAGIQAHRAPTVAEQLTAAKVAKRLEAREWLTAINGRAYEHAGNSEDFDDVIVAIRTACRAMINNFAAEITPAIAARVSAVEAKVAFSGAAAQFDLIDKAKAGKTLMAAEINALPDIASVNSYQVTDATAAALWAAANPDVTPTLGELLAQFPVRV